MNVSPEFLANEKSMAMIEEMCKRVYHTTKTFRSVGNRINEMKNPKLIETVIEGATYKVPTFKVTNEGIEDGAGIEIVFCKGNKEDEAVLRQEGMFTETLIQTAKQYLESVNVGPMATRETSMVITKLDEALMWINKRAEDRKLRGVQTTYQK